MRLLRLGFREDFCDWLAASDLVVGKFGGPTAAEACATGIPMIVYEPIPGQEEANADHLVGEGAALWPRTRAALACAVGQLLAQGGREERERIGRAANRMARPHAASEVARVLADALAVRA
jgi:processive 1,2-diacylglycerol beta-glucosyltransferase